MVSQSQQQLPLKRQWEPSSRWTETGKRGQSVRLPGRCVISSSADVAIHVHPEGNNGHSVKPVQAASCAPQRVREKHQAGISKGIEYLARVCPRAVCVGEQRSEVYGQQSDGRRVGNRFTRNVGSSSLSTVARSSNSKQTDPLPCVPPSWQCGGPKHSKTLLISICPLT